MDANVVTHTHFHRPPVVLPKRRRGRLSPGVVRIESAPRLRVGVLAEIVASKTKTNTGRRVRITAYDPAADRQFEVRSLDGGIVCTDGAVCTDGVWFKANQLRRVWTGNTTPVKAGVL